MQQIHQIIVVGFSAYFYCLIPLKPNHFFLICTFWGWWYYTVKIHQKTHHDYLVYFYCFILLTPKRTKHRFFGSYFGVKIDQIIVVGLSMYFYCFIPLNPKCTKISVFRFKFRLYFFSFGILLRIRYHCLY